MNTVGRIVALGLGLAMAAGTQAEECARISTFDVAPRSQQLFPAVLIAIDGKLPGPTAGPTWRITPGRHVLTVAEAIDANRFLPAENRERDGRRAGRYKTLEIDAKPGITYRLAVRLDLARRDRVRENEYWEPVIWKESREPCN